MIDKKLHNIPCDNCGAIALEHSNYWLFTCDSNYKCTKCGHVQTEISPGYDGCDIYDKIERHGT